jgi:hypothetical protein
MSEPDMKLPAGLSCGNCRHLPRCQALFRCKPTNTTCDWSPSRFRLPPVVPPQAQWSPYP